MQWNPEELTSWRCSAKTGWSFTLFHFFFAIACSRELSGGLLRGATLGEDTLLVVSFYAYMYTGAHANTHEGGTIPHFGELCQLGPRLGPRNEWLSAVPRADT